jgi:uncharacterized membrane protein (UPF0127 family)
MKIKVWKSFVLVAVLLIAVFLLVVNFHKNTKIENPQDIKYLKIAGKNIKVELALTEKEQEQGLSGRKELQENSGMLFVFDKADKYPFWMKDMNFSIDIIWFDENLNVVYIKKEAKPESYPESFSSSENAKYVLEVNAGFSDKNDLKVGDGVLFTY